MKPERPEPKSIFDDGYNPSPEHVSLLEAELHHSKTLEEEQARLKKAAESCMTPQQRATFNGSDEMFFSVPPPELGSALPDKK